MLKYYPVYRYLYASIFNSYIFISINIRITFLEYYLIYCLNVIASHIKFLFLRLHDLITYMLVIFKLYF